MSRPLKEGKGTGATLRRLRGSFGISGSLDSPGDRGEGVKGLETLKWTGRQIIRRTD